jgi:hypothetical protein
MAEEVKTESAKKNEDWMNSKWRPMMGWSYMATCVFDFILAPVLWSVLQAISHGNVSSQWQPLTLQGAGLYHLAMGAVLGIAAYGRTQEKMAGANNGGLPAAGSVGTTYTPPAPVPQSTAPAPVAPSFTPAPSWGSAPVATEVTTAKSGKPGPAQPDHPEI